MYDGGGKGGGTACRAPGMPIGVASEYGERRWCCETRMEGVDDIVPRAHQKRSTITSGSRESQLPRGKRGDLLPALTCSLQLVPSYERRSALSNKQQ
jgi:hypothetical protein